MRAFLLHDADGRTRTDGLQRQRQNEIEMLGNKGRQAGEKKEGDVKLVGTTKVVRKCSRLQEGDPRLSEYAMNLGPKRNGKWCKIQLIPITCRRRRHENRVRARPCMPLPYPPLIVACCFH